MPKRKTQTEFIAEARAKHGSFYDYSKAHYAGSATKLIVICPNHGEFMVAAGHHLNGVGCRKCYADRSRNSGENIIARFRAAHDDRYNYDKVVYERMNLKVIITCSVHGDFEQAPVAHINGSGCVKCANIGQALTTEKFIEKARDKHGDCYDYSKVEYINVSTKVSIICSAHGVFYQTPGNHIKGTKCPDCAKDNVIEVSHAFEYKGVKYRSIKHACQALDKDYWSIIKRLDAGWTKAQAFDEEPANFRHPLQLNGVAYNGVENVVRQLNIPISSATVRRRLAKGMSLEDAICTPPKYGYRNGIIYSITNLLNDKQYVGLTTTSLQERWERHLKQTMGKSGSLIHKAILEFGKENFIIEMLDNASTVKSLQAKEREWIKKLNTVAPNGYNVTLGGEMGGSPGKPTKIPGDPIVYPSVKAASEALSQRLGINREAAEKRIYMNRIDVNKPHGMSKTRIYKYWGRLIYQSANPKSRRYNGSVVCDRWQDFTNFYTDMGDRYKEGCRLKLVNINLPYSPENCEWIDF